MDRHQLSHSVSAFRYILKKSKTLCLYGLHAALHAGDHGRLDSILAGLRASSSRQASILAEDLAAAGRDVDSSGGASD